MTCGEAIGDIDFDLPEDKEKQAGSKHKDLLTLVPPGDNYLFLQKKEVTLIQFLNGDQDTGHSCLNSLQKNPHGLFRPVFQITWGLFIGKIVS